MKNIPLQQTFFDLLVFVTMRVERDGGWIYDCRMRLKELIIYWRAALYIQGDIRTMRAIYLGREDNSDQRKGG
jgi:hypothetical protein